MCAGQIGVMAADRIQHTTVVNDSSEWCETANLGAEDVKKLCEAGGGGWCRYLCPHSYWWTAFIHRSSTDGPPGTVKFN